MKRTWIGLAIFAAALVAGIAWLSLRPPATGAPAAAPAPAARYHCPMHPAMTSDRPADCPICGMRMVPIDEEPDSRSSAVAEPSRDAGSDKPPAGLAAVQLTPRKQQLIGVKTAVVARTAFRRTIRAVGRIAYDETRERHVTTKSAGYVEKLHANALGEFVTKGQPLLEIFSPELLASQQELLLALRTRARGAGSTLPSVAGAGDDLVASARRRLELFDVSERQIRELEATGKPSRTVTMYAPVSGYLTHRAVTEGDRIDAGTHLMEITDLSRVWVMASVYEYELPFVRAGQRGTVTLAYLPGKVFEGRVTLVYPALDAATRTAQVRLELANESLLLKPDMFAEVALEADLGSRLAVPDSAVIETGTRSVVFVDRGEGRFEPREITVGLRLEDEVEVLGGVAEGERIVVSGNFLVDSESKLKAALAASGEATGGAKP